MILCNHCSLHISRVAFGIQVDVRAKKRVAPEGVVFSQICNDNQETRHNFSCIGKQLLLGDRRVNSLQDVFLKDRLVAHEQTPFRIILVMYTTP